MFQSEASVAEAPTQIALDDLLSPKFALTCGWRNPRWKYGSSRVKSTSTSGVRYSLETRFRRLPETRFPPLACPTSRYSGKLGASFDNGRARARRPAAQSLAQQINHSDYVASRPVGLGEKVVSAV